ncbi:MAG: ribonuclease J, partial [Clostridia bacterium]|nr:ribonuclease J [Clostridia bacterium]
MKKVNPKSNGRNSNSNRNNEKVEKKVEKSVKATKTGKREKTQKPAKPIKIIPLGGLLEIGKNLTVFEYGDDVVILDCGMAFPDDDMLGVD